ncbi:hypothetical protein [Catenulispora subtropica]|uniref:Uncharacterized protein n=1 Tax=Catenulispora subtropica TaxID=450798 RepID=A0ABN2QSC9_9ACTN
MNEDDVTAAPSALTRLRGGVDAPDSPHAPAAHSSTDLVARAEAVLALVREEASDTTPEEDQRILAGIWERLGEPETQAGGDADIAEAVLDDHFGRVLAAPDPPVSIDGLIAEFDSLLALLHDLKRA